MCERREKRKSGNIEISEKATNEKGKKKTRERKVYHTNTSSFRKIEPTIQKRMSKANLKGSSKMSRTSKTVKGEEEARGFEDTKTNMTMKQKVGHNLHDTVLMSLITTLIYMCVHAMFSYILINFVV